MNEYTLCELDNILKSGGKLEKTYTFEITEKLHFLFEDISGSHNPLHTDDEFARSRGFREKIGYGFLTAALMSQMVGEQIPGHYGMCRGFNIDFHKPVYIGDHLTYQGKLVKVYKSIRQILLDVVITNQDGEVVGKGQMKAGVSE